MVAPSNPSTFVETQRPKYPQLTTCTAADSISGPSWVFQEMRVPRDDPKTIAQQPGKPLLWVPSLYIAIGSSLTMIMIFEELMHVHLYIMLLGRDHEREKKHFCRLHIVTLCFHPCCPLVARVESASGLTTCPNGLLPAPTRNPPNKVLRTGAQSYPPRGISNPILTL